MSSILCGLSINVPMLVAARILQGIGAAMMMPVGRLAIIRTFPKSELLVAMNFVIIPALIGPLLGPTVGGLIVHWLSWREIFFVNVPVGIVALLLAYRHMPDYRGDASRPLDIVGLVLFGSGTALFSWLLEIFGEHHIDVTSAAILLLLSFSLLATYVWYARNTSFHCSAWHYFDCAPSALRFLADSSRVLASAGFRSCCRSSTRLAWECRPGSQAC